LASSAASNNMFDIKDSFKVKYIDGAIFSNLDEILEEILVANPRMIALNSFHQTFTVLEFLIHGIRIHDKKICVLVGGMSAMLKPSIILNKFPNVICSIGEGEKVVRQLLSNYPLEEINGIAYSESNHIIINKSVPLNISENEDVKLIYQEFGGIFKNSSNQVSAPILTSRGCSWKCSFCSTPNSMGKLRHRKMSRVTTDLFELYHNYNIQMIHVYDDIFISSHERMNVFLDEMKTKNIYGKLDLKVMARADTISQLPISLLKDLKKCGIKRIAIGIESGSNRILKKIKPGVTRENIIEALKNLQTARIEAKGFFMYGIPDENYQNMEETYAFAKFLRDSNLLVNGVAHYAKAYPGTEWESEALIRNKEIALSNKYISVTDLDGNFIKRNPAIPQSSLCDVNSYQILEFISETNNLW
jgi:anaerobic magnesium-protoporphyrin IX monomethyl ester cyclase